MEFLNVMRHEAPYSRLQKRQQAASGGGKGNNSENNGRIIHIIEIAGLSLGAIVIIALVVIFVRRKIVKHRKIKNQKIDDIEWDDGNQKLEEGYGEKSTKKEKYSPNPPLMIVPKLANSPNSTLSPRLPNSASPRLPTDPYDSYLATPSSSSSFTLQTKNSMESLRPLINSRLPSSPHFPPSPHFPSHPQNSYRGPKSPNLLHFPTSPQRLFRSPPHSPRTLEDPPRSPLSIKSDNQSIVSRTFGDNYVNHEVKEYQGSEGIMTNSQNPLKNEPDNVASKNDPDNLSTNSSRDAKESDKVDILDTSNQTLADKARQVGPEHNESRPELVEETLVVNSDRDSPSPQLMNLTNMKLVKPIRSNMIIETESHNIIINSAPSIPPPSDASKVQPKMDQQSQSNMKIEKVDGAPNIPEIITPTSADSIPVSQMHGIDGIKRNAETVKNLKESDSNRTENNANVAKEKRTVRFKTNLSNQEKTPKDSNPVTNKLNKDDGIHLQTTSGSCDDSENRTSTSSEYQMYDFDLSSYQDNKGVPEILAKIR